MTCAVETCGKPSYVRGYCSAHYTRLKRHGSAEAGGGPRGICMPWIEEHVGFPGLECLPWPFRANVSGYGQIRIDGKTHLAHREMCRRAHGEPPSPRHEAAHSCGKGASGCCNPNHLRWALRVENEQDKIQHGTNSPPRFGWKKLRAHEVRAVKDRLALGHTKTSIGKAFGVSRSAIALIASGKSWACL